MRDSLKWYESHTLIVASTETQVELELELVISPEEGGQVLVHDDGLEGGDDSTPGSLKNVLIIPVWIDFPHSVRLQGYELVPLS